VRSGNLAIIHFNHSKRGPRRDEDQGEDQSRDAPVAGESRWRREPPSRPAIADSRPTNAGKSVRQPASAALSSVLEGIVACGDSRYGLF